MENVLMRVILTLVSLLCVTSAQQYPGQRGSQYSRQGQSRVIPPPTWKYVDTQRGRVAGRIREVERIYERDPYTNELLPKSYIVEYLGIPYAEPPRGYRRFKWPEPKKPYQLHDWQLEYHTEMPGMKYMPACPQTVPVEFQRFIKETSEDCLYLNVFTPYDIRPNENLPVMVHIHGGSFTTGASQLYPGHKFAESRVIVVTFNYRLGALGFLTMATHDYPGNQGFMDQVTALHWVDENIRVFHGDNRKVTIFGESAGAACVGLHMLNPHSRGLFHNAIASSGADVADWAVYTSYQQAINHTRMLSDKIGCFWNDKTIDCLKQKAPDDFPRAVVTPDYGIRPPWAPIVDGTFRRGHPDVVFDKSPRELLERGTVFTRVPYLVGVNKDEASSFFMQLVDNPNFIDNQWWSHEKMYEVKEFLDADTITEQAYREYVYNFTLTMNYTHDWDTRKYIVDTMAFEYTYWADPQNRTLRKQSMIDLESDCFFKAPAELSAKLRTTWNRTNIPENRLTYLYTFDYRSRHDMFPRWTGVPHGKEIPYVWGFPFYPNTYPEFTYIYGVNWTYVDRNVSEFMHKMWVNFANYSRPIMLRNELPRMFENASWRPYTLDEQFYLKVNTTPELLLDFMPHKLAFWNEYLPLVADLLLPWHKRYNIHNDTRYNTATWSLVGVVMCLLLVIAVITGIYCTQKRRLEHSYA